MSVAETAPPTRRIFIFDQVSRCIFLHCKSGDEEYL